MKEISDLMKYLKIIAVIYPLFIIVTFGHASRYFAKQAESDCIYQGEHSKYGCSLWDLNYRPEAMLYSALWPYYWSERLWSNE